MARLGLVIAVAAAVAACGGPDDPDAGPDAYVPPPPPPPPPPCNNTPPGPTCSNTCGNNHRDTQCWQNFPSPMNQCPLWTPTPTSEPCDGTDTPTCEQLGFYGGTSSCSACLGVETAACDACASAVSCDTLALFDMRNDGIVASGSTVALVGIDQLALVEGMSSTPVGIDTIQSAVAVPSGWLVAHGTSLSLTPVGATGTLGTAQPLNVTATATAMAYGPGGRVLVAHKVDVTGQERTTARLVDTTGATVVPAFDLFPNSRTTSVATDGTNFFVGGDGSLARVAPDGTHRVVGGFPTDPTAGAPEIVRVLWSGTTGWYVATTDAPLTPNIRAQRFDANGDPVGALITPSLAATAWAFAAAGDDLVVVRTEDVTGGRRLSRVHVDRDGMVGTALEVGFGRDLVRVTTSGSDLVVVWPRFGHLELARVAP